MKKKYLKFDARPNFPVMYFTNDERGKEELQRFWHREWLIGCRPKVTGVNSLPIDKQTYDPRT